MDTLVTLMVIFLTVRMEGGSMSDNSAIEWTDATWNPTTGCTKVSTGCDRCYAERIALRFGRSFDLELHPDRLEQPLRWRRPRRVFVNSVSDLFHRDVPWGFVDQVFTVMEAAEPPHLPVADQAQLHHEGLSAVEVRRQGVPSSHLVRCVGRGPESPSESEAFTGEPRVSVVPVL